MDMVNGRFWTGLVLILAFLFNGCGSPDGQKTGTVSGKVTLDGEPLEEGGIAFDPKDGVGPSSGATIKDGYYSAAIPLGEKRVKITASKMVGETKTYDTPDSPTRPVFKELVPPKYNIDSTLTITVKEGSNDGAFNLESAKPM